jgi:hypothetical protein
MVRAVFAFIVAPFPIALTQAIVVALWPKVGKGVFEHPSSMFIAMALYFYIFGLLLGVPAWLIVRKRSTSVKIFIYIGSLVALVPVGAALAMMMIRGQGTAYVVSYTLALFALGGTAAGGLFWALAIRKKGDAHLATMFS